MTRIIPWTLPPVKGGSIGGYTPASGDSDPVTPVQYFDFSNAVFKILSGGSEYVQGPMVSFTPSGTDTQVVSINGFYGSSTPFISGIAVVDLVGVSSVSVKYEGQTTTDPYYDFSTDNLMMSIDPLTLAVTFVSGDLNITKKLSGGQTGTSAPLKDTIKATFYVYNGNGEIIQSEEVSYS